MTATASELIDRAAQKLGLLRLGQSLTAHDSERITKAYAEIYEKLKKDGYATWAYSGNIPNEFVNDLAFLISDSCADDYGLSQARYERIKLGAQIAMRDIMKNSSPDYVSQDEPKDF